MIHELMHVAERFHLVVGMPFLVRELWHVARVRLAVRWLVGLCKNRP